jgi:hypothetical protein
MFLLTEIILIVFFCILRSFVLYLEFSKNIIRYGVLEWE